MPSNLLILCHLFFLLPSIFLSIKVFSNESALLIRGVFFWPSLPFVAAVYHSLLSFHKWVWGKKQVLSGTNFRNLHFLVLCYNCLGLEEGGNQIPSHREISVRTGTREKSRASGVRLCDPMNRSTPGLPVRHQLPEFTQTHVHWVSDAIQPSHPMSSPSPPAFNLAQHQGLFKWVISLHQVVKVLDFQLQLQSFQWIFRTDCL